MAWFILSQIFSTFLTLFRLGCISDKDKDLEILILRQQLSILQRQIDKPIKPNQAHLRRVLIEFLDYYNRRRPHQGIDQQSPIERPEPLTEGLIQKRPVLGGIINDYFRVPPLNAATQPA